MVRYSTIFHVGFHALSDGGVWRIIGLFDRDWRGHGRRWESSFRARRWRLWLDGFVHRLGFYKWTHRSGKEHRCRFTQVTLSRLDCATCSEMKLIVPACHKQLLMGQSKRRDVSCSSRRWSLFARKG